MIIMLILLLVITMNTRGTMGSKTSVIARNLGGIKEDDEK